MIQSGVRPDSVGALTPAQLHVILLEPTDAGATVALTPSEAEELRIRRSRQKQSWIEDELANAQRPDEHRTRHRSHQGIAMLAKIADSLTNLPHRPAAHAMRLHDATAAGLAEMVRGALRDSQLRIEELLARNFRPAASFQHDGAPRFSDGP